VSSTPLAVAEHFELPVAVGFEGLFAGFVVAVLRSCCNWQPRFDIGLSDSRNPFRKGYTWCRAAVGRNGALHPIDSYNLSPRATHMRVLVGSPHIQTLNSS